MRGIRSSFCTLCALSLLLPSLLIAQPESGAGTFVENRGQQTATVLFDGRLADGEIAFRRDGFDLLVPVRSLVADDDADAHAPSEYDASLSLRFIHPDPFLTVDGQDRLPGVRNYYDVIPDSDPVRVRRIEGVPTWRQIRYERVWRGIDAVMRSEGGRMKYDMIVAPEASVRTIGLRYEGADGSLSIDPAGRLVIPTRFGRLYEAAPIAWQDIDGERRMVEVRYRLLGDDSFGFVADAYDPEHPLVIDPCLAIEYFTYLGGGDFDEVTAMAVDSTGASYAVGMTRAVNFPGTTTAPGMVKENRAFVTKISSDGSTILYTTLFPAEYVGQYGFIDSVGPFYEALGESVAATDDGRAVVAITTNQRGFPTTAGALAQTRSSNRVSSVCGPPFLDNFDAFVARLSTNGTVEWGTYLGGGDDDFVQDVGLRPDGSIALTGITAAARCGSRGDTLAFPVTVPHRTFSADAALRGSETFVSVLEPDGASLRFSALVGGSRDEIAGALDVGTDGRIYVVSSTTSTDHFTTASASNPTAAEGLTGAVRDLFIFRADPESAAIDYAGYVPDGGGIGRRGLGAAGIRHQTGQGLRGLDREDVEQDIIVLSDGRVIVGGSTRSVTLSVGGGLRSTPYNPGGNANAVPDETVDAFLLQYDMNGGGVTRSTYLGGNGFDGFGGFDLDAEGNLAVAITTASTDFRTTTITVQDRLEGTADAALAILGTNLDRLEFATYFGGPATSGTVLYEQTVRGLVADPRGGVTMHGGTTSSRLPVSPNAVDKQTDFFDGWIAKLSSATEPRLGAPISRAFPLDPCGGVQSSGVLIFNSGTTPLRIDSITFARGLPYRLVAPPSFPLLLGACETATIDVGLDVSDTNIACGQVFRDTVIFHAGNAAIPVVRTPLVATKTCAFFELRDRVVEDPRYRLGSLRGYNLLAFVTGEVTQQVTIEPAPENDGVIRLRDPFVDRGVDPGVADIPFDVVASDTGRYCARFFVTVEPCTRRDTITICTYVRTGLFNIEPDTLDLGLVACGVTTIPTKIFNTGNDTLEFRLSDLRGPNALDVFYTIPWDSIRKLPPGDTFSFETFYRPFGIGDRRSEPVFETSNLTREFERQVITARLDTVVITLATTSMVGAFGDLLEYPVSIDFIRTGGAPLTELTLLVDFDRNLLDIADIVADGKLLDGWRIAERRVLPSGEALLLVPDQGAPPLQSSGELLSLRFRVLRGDSISTPITVGLADPSSFCIDLDAPGTGGFALSPECLATERLLRADGRMLRPIVPNPSSSDVTLRFRVPYDAPISIEIIDVAGNRAALPVDQVMGPGEYALQLPSGLLPPGLYYCRMTLDGRASDTRTIVIVE